MTHINIFIKIIKKSIHIKLLIYDCGFWILEKKSTDSDTQ